MGSVEWNGSEISIQSYHLLLFKSNKAITILRRDVKGLWETNLNSDIKCVFSKVLI
jgi:hypothetical protein